MAAADFIIETMDMIIFIVKWFWWAFLLGYIWFLRMRWKNWPIDVVIIEKRGENLIKTNDRAGRYTDPYTGNTGYHLMKAKDNIPVVSFDIMLHNNALHTNIFERFINLLRGNSGTVFLFRYGSKQYKPIKINQNGKIVEKWEEIRDKEGNPIFIKIYTAFDPRNVGNKPLGLLDFEVVDWDNMNFMVQEAKTTMERRQKKSEFWKGIVIPLAILGVTAMICIVMIKFGYDYAMSMKATTPQAAKEPAKAPNIPVIGDLLPGT